MVSATFKKESDSKFCHHHAVFVDAKFSITTKNTWFSLETLEQNREEIQFCVFHASSFSTDNDTKSISAIFFYLHGIGT